MQYELETDWAPTHTFILKMSPKEFETLKSILTRAQERSCPGYEIQMFCEKALTSMSCMEQVAAEQRGE